MGDTPMPPAGALPLHPELANADSTFFEDRMLRSLALLLKPLVVSLANHVTAPFDRLRACE